MGTRTCAVYLDTLTDLVLAAKHGLQLTDMSLFVVNICYGYHLHSGPALVGAAGKAGTDGPPTHRYVHTYITCNLQNALGFSRMHTHTYIHVYVGAQHAWDRNTPS